MHVLTTEEDDGIARMTVAFAEDDYMFEVTVDDGVALVDYEETRTWRGQIHVSEPDKDIYKALMTSDEMTAFLNKHNCKSVKRAPLVP